MPRIEGAVGVPDAFQRLWMPHRMAYIQTNHTGDEPEDEGCPFCGAPTLPDERGADRRARASTPTCC